jgi:hypothetical protein
MPEAKKEDPKTVPAPHAVATEVSTSEDQYSTGPAGVPEEDDPNATKTYYIREGATHLHIEKGEPRDLTKFGQKAQLTAAQYDAFKDKFLTEPEYKAVKAGKDALAEGASAATLDGSTSENPTPEERNAENNEPASGKSSASGERGTPPAETKK